MRHARTMAKRTTKRPSRTSAMRQSKYPEIEALSEAERQNLEREIRESNVRYRGSTLENVVDAALAYYLEKERRDPAHKARLSKREEVLRRAIKQAYEAMHPRPITDFDLAMATTFRDLERDTET